MCILQKKLDLDELTVERTNRRRHVKEELSSRRSQFFMERPGDHIVLDAVGIFDEDHSSSGESDRVSHFLVVAQYSVE